MQREIKFRGYFDGIMYYPELSHNYANAIFSCSKLVAVNTQEKARMAIMQFTGLKDKNGKEVYEGDIVSYYQPFAKRTDTHIVKWDDRWACFGLFENGNEWCKENDWMKIKDIEVIGNIYENPELLKP